MAEKFDYFEASKANVHFFLMKTIAALKQEIGDSNYSYTSTLWLGLDDLHLFAEEAKAQPVKIGLPIADLNHIEHENYSGRVDINEKFREGFWKFKSGKDNVYVGNIGHLEVQYGDTYFTNISILVSKNAKDAKAFLEAYHQANWKRNRKTPCILSYSGERIKDFRRMSWDQIYLPNDMTSQIRTEIETFFTSKVEYEKHNLDHKRGMILVGRPGNGKTAICRAVATTATVPVVYCSLDADDMFKILEQLERTIRANAPCITMIEDADTLGGNPSLRSALLNMLDGLFTASGVFTIASSNAPEKLDEAFTGRPSRFDSFYLISNPKQPERLKILMSRLSDRGKQLGRTEIASLVKNMNGLSAASVQEIANCALLDSLKTKKLLSMDMLQVALEKVKKHIKMAEDGLEGLTRGSIGFSPQDD